MLLEPSVVQSIVEICQQRRRREEDGQSQHPASFDGGRHKKSQGDESRTRLLGRQYSRQGDIWEAECV
jgi:hypothetical protein